MKFTKATNMGLHVVTYLVQNSTNKEYLSINELSDKFDVSPSYLSKILTQLSKAGLIASVSGVKGGYRLNKSIETITFFDVIQAIEGMPESLICLVESPTDCPIQQTLQEVQTAMWEELKNKKLSDLKGL
ncbi:Rrf2 family transcriptional regulator [Enterococcus saigonensis]|uniref:Rrf2 family transcriptional regulator n=1 Tax=Enterococcus saigonensis TaxID=1805431 RepID=A0A679I9Z4_9ENTE|nr:Rrf2 family transcriptional regulator [Enterococcus saigonensis]BCA85200.1 Rrf2 family transcriptional regulator [Enterococcus saigonensis]